MYCVKCGVKLQEGVERCPLCATPVWNPDAGRPETSYPEDREPRLAWESRLPAACVLTAVTLLAAVAILSVCFSLYHRLAWGGYAVFGAGLGYVVFVLPLWFRRFSPLVAIPADHAAALLYVFYICRYTGGHWFWRFAFPVIAVCCALVLGLYCLLRFVRRGRPFIIGGFLIALGGYTVLVEFFSHVAFGLPMFRWSLYPAGSCLAAGLFTLLIGMIRPLRQALERRFFL